MGDDFTLPFGIEFVVERDLAPGPGFRVWNRSGDSFDITCPFCGAKRKFNVNTAKNVARCNRCGGTGGYNTITLHAELNHISNSESYRDLMGMWNGSQSGFKSEHESHAPQKTQTETVPAKIETRDAVYRALLSGLTLSERHRSDLLRRGLTEGEIERGLYKSVPEVGFHTLALGAVKTAGMTDALNGKGGIGIPGFCITDNMEKIRVVKNRGGYFVPVMQKDGMISGMQIRYDELPENATYDEREGYRKYAWFSSSGRKGGCPVTGCENIHFAGNPETDPETVNLTEGVLKADVASALSGKAFLGLPGVNATGQLKKTLSSLYERGARHVRIYVDMDYRHKREVAAALESIKKQINGAGRFSFETTGKKGITGEPAFTFDDAGRLRNVMMTFENPLPENALFYIDGMRVRSKILGAEHKSVSVDGEPFAMARCTGHLFAAAATDGGKTRIISGFTFIKHGMTYEMVTWDEKYKGIDDWYLHLRENGISEFT